MKCTFISLTLSFCIAVGYGLGICAQSAPVAPLSERIAAARAARDAVYKKAPLKDRIAAYFAGSAPKKERVRTLVELTDAEWQLRKELLKQQKKNRLQLFINKHEQELRMALIAIGLVGVGGFFGRQMYTKNQRNEEARQAFKTQKNQSPSAIPSAGTGAVAGAMADVD
jgi:hypothetical protein